MLSLSSVETVLKTKGQTKMSVPYLSFLAFIYLLLYFLISIEIIKTLNIKPIQILLQL
jgi:hypothetical protein